MLTIEVLSPEKAIHHTKGVEAIIPTADGQVGIRTGHLPLLAPMVAGTVIVKKEDGSEEALATFGGFVEVYNDTVYLMTDSAELAEDMDELKIQEAVHRAEALKEEARDTSELREASALLAANLLRLKAVQRHRRGQR